MIVLQTYTQQVSPDSVKFKISMTKHQSAFNQQEF